MFLDWAREEELAHADAPEKENDDKGLEDGVDDVDMGKEDCSAAFHRGSYQPSMADLEDLNRSGALSVPTQLLPAPSSKDYNLWAEEQRQMFLDMDREEELAHADEEDAEGAEDAFSDISSDSDLFNVHVWPEKVTM